MTTLFSVFPLTDTDIWWHLACAREWVPTWTPVRSPIVNVHEYFQQAVYAVYQCGGAPLLVAFKAILWGSVMALFIWRIRKSSFAVCLALFLLFIFRYQFEIRPVVFTLFFLGVYWNVLPTLFKTNGPFTTKKGLMIFALLLLQWLWCKCQGLYILGPLFAIACFIETNGVSFKFQRNVVYKVIFVVAMFLMPFLHGEGLSLFFYPFGLADRLLGLSSSASVFASEIAENRSPLTLILQGENVFACVLMVLVSLMAVVMGLINWRRHNELWMLVLAVLALVAERNFVLLLPVFLTAFMPWVAEKIELNSILRSAEIILCAALVGFWGKSLVAYDSSMVASQRVPVYAAEWMKANPHEGRLFNDDRTGGYLAFANPLDSTFVDGRFILKTAEFFERYLRYADVPETFLHDADSMNVDRALFPIRYYARWNRLLNALNSAENWHLMYQDSDFVVFDRDFEHR